MAGGLTGVVDDPSASAAPDFVAKVGGLAAEFSFPIFAAACRSDKQIS